MNANLTTARKNAEAAWNADPSEENLKALQAAGAAEMDAYLGGFDKILPERRTAKHTTTPGPVMVHRQPRARAKAAQIFLMSLTAKAARSTAWTRELAVAYNQYVTDALADTDGYFAPVSFDLWASTNR